MSEPSEPPFVEQQASPAAIRWRSWPARDHWIRTSLVVVGLLIVVVVVTWLTGRTYLGLLALAALLLALWRFFLPVEFELSDQGVDQWLFGRQRRIPWQAIQGCEICASGVLLLPDDHRSALSAFGGLYLPWSTHRDEILAHVRHHLEWSRKAQ